MSVIYRERERERERDWDDSRTAVSSRRDGGYTTVKRYRIGEDDSSRSTVFDRDRRDTRVEETRIVRREREPEPPRTERDIIIRREREEPRAERDLVIRRERVEEEPRRDFTVVDRRRESEPVEERDLVIRRTFDRSPEPRNYDRELVRYDDRSYERDYAYDKARDLAPPQDLHRYSRSTEYFSRPEQPQTIIIKNEPIIIRERVRDDSDFQLIRREEVEDRPLARREPSRDDEYYYERRVRETEGGRPRDRSEDFYERDSRYRRDVSPGDSISQAGRRDRDYSSDDSMVYVKKEVRESSSRGRSESPHHRRHVAEGALAGVGVAEILRHHSKKQGKDTSGPLARLGKDIGAGVLGVVAAEGVSRARSRIRSKSRRRDHDSRSSSRETRRTRRRSRSESRSRLKQAGAVGLGAAALAVAAAVARNRNKSQDGRRSRSRRRRSSVGPETVDDARNPGHRNKVMAEAGLAGAAVAGLIERARSKSRKRTGDRSQSRLRTGLPIAAAGLGSAAIAGLYEKNKAKREEAAAIAERKSRSRTRSQSRHSVYPDSSRGAISDPNMIEYGNDPVYGAIPQQGYYGQPAPDSYYDNVMVPAAAAGAAYGAPRGERSRSRSRSRSRRRSSSSSSTDDHGRRHGRRRKHRSRSQSHDLATAGVAAAGGAMAANEYQKRKERKRAEKEARREERRRREAEAAHQDTYEEGYDPAPYVPPAQEQYYPQTNTFPPPPGAVPQEYTQPQNPYNPAEYQAHPGTVPPAGAAYNQNYPANPAVDQYGRPRRGDENV